MLEYRVDVKDWFLIVLACSSSNIGAIVLQIHTSRAVPAGFRGGVHW